jgi:hypothetical protein
MGSKVSSEIKEEQKNEEKIKKICSYDYLSFFFTNSNSYQGLKSDKSSKSNHNSSPKTSSNSEEYKVEEKETINNLVNIKVATTFIWREGGNSVYVTGSFSNWKQWFLMKKSETNDKEYILTLDLPREVHQYKFIVDSVWKCSRDFPKMNDGNGNHNNYIDTTTYAIPTDIIEKKRENKLKEVIYKFKLKFIVRQR